jgi:predicted nucleic acid-binding Zn ribbon protein
MQKLDYSSPGKERDVDSVKRERMRELMIVVATILIVIAVPLVVMLIREWR